VILGLGVAALWGVGDLAATIASRRLGSSFMTLTVAHVAELALCFSLWAAVTPGSVEASASVVSLLLCVGVLTAGSYGCLYRGLMLGPVTLVAPIASAYAVGPTILAVIVLHERLAAPAGVGAAATIVGAILVGTAPLRGDVGHHARGILFAVAAMVGFAVSAFLIASLSGVSGWLLPLFVSRIGVVSAVAITISAMPRLRGNVVVALRKRRAVVVAVAVGVCNLAGTALYAHGGEIGQVAVVSAVSALFPLVPILGGIVLFHERLSAAQIAGIVIVLSGLFLLGLG
jgi:drug/metabolite transporter (DMT)-like permease